MEIDPFIARFLVGVMMVALVGWFVDILFKGYQRSVDAKNSWKVNKEIEDIRRCFSNLVEVDTKISYIEKLRVRVRFRQSSELLAGFILNEHDAPYEPVLYIAAPDDETRLKLAAKVVQAIIAYHDEKGCYPDALRSKALDSKQKSKTSTMTTFEA